MIFQDILASEWLKLRSVRWTWFTIACTLLGIVASVCIAWNVVHMWEGATPMNRHHITVTPLTASVTALVVDLCLGILGVLSITGEYSTGMISTSLVAVPRRHVFLLAKILVVMIVSLFVGEVVIFTSYFCTHWVIGNRPIPNLTAPLSQEIPVLLCLGLGGAVFALVGLGLGFILRSTAGAITTLIAGFLYLIEIVAIHLPTPWNTRLLSITIQYLVGELSGKPQLAAINHSLLSPIWATVCLASYVFFVLGIAYVFLKRRDA
ncbi:ABC transporter permease [Pullulanibacillus sp. KACC 23026]|uniref:ABC transporter permease n=1 Tax=Pullulanibacillus sp. KACC 23026 TaxID=3028315 RepID=UPI0023B0F033|nr:ABC transporter permease [Pullulanibacillus sp. KACC 23026]WEG11128.1 ABC transporter permease [Pullulanibacillus sp. KACC 23026]